MQPCRRTCESSPKTITGAIPKRGANCGAEKSGQRTRKTGCRASLAGHAESLPAYVGAKAGEEHGHVGGQAAAADINIVTHLVNKYEDGETDAEGGAEQRPVNAHESEEAEEEFEFEDGEQKSLTFCKEYGDRSEGTELAGPGKILLWRRQYLRGEFEFVNLNSPRRYCLLQSRIFPGPASSVPSLLSPYSLQKVRLFCSPSSNSNSSSASSLSWAFTGRCSAPPSASVSPSSYLFTRWVTILISAAAACPPTCPCSSPALAPTYAGRLSA